jgi:hypothetical protein
VIILLLIPGQANNQLHQDMNSGSTIPVSFAADWKSQKKKMEFEDKSVDIF